MKGMTLIISLLISLLLIYGLYKMYIDDSLKKSGSTTDVVIDNEAVNIKNTDRVKKKLNDLLQKQEELLKKRTDEMTR